MWIWNFKRLLTFFNLYCVASTPWNLWNFSVLLILSSPVPHFGRNLIKFLSMWLCTLGLKLQISFFFFSSLLCHQCPTQNRRTINCREKLVMLWELTGSWIFFQCALNENLDFRSRRKKFFQGFLNKFFCESIISQGF